MVVDSERRQVDKPSGIEPWLRWAGGKRWLVERIVPEILATKPSLYIEPFLGGGAVALALPVNLSKQLSDVNPHLIDCWLCIKHMPGSLFAELRDTERIFGDSQEGYLAARDTFNAMVPAPRRMWAKRSALFLYLNARCFNGLWRTNARGLFNVPYGKLERPRQISAEEMSAFENQLKHCELSSESFTTILGGRFSRATNKVRGNPDAMRTMMRGIAIYVDPPYDGTFDGYTKDGFGEGHQLSLAQQLGSYAAAGAAVWATNVDTERVRQLYSWAQIESVSEQHSVGSKADRRGKRGCVIIRGGAAIQ